jgi:hypothetical protein
MINQASPGVNSREVDLSYVVRAEGGVAGAFVGAFQWGPVEEIIRVNGSTEGMLQRFFRPDNDTARYWLSVRDYLFYNDNALVVRLVGESATNAVAPGEAPTIVKNRGHFDDIDLSGRTFVAKYPGALGNSIGVYAADEFGFEGWEYADEFTYAPQAGEFNVVVVDTQGAWTGSAGTVLERYELMQNVANARKGDGTSADINEVINRSSRFVWLGDGDEIGFTYEVDAATVVDGGTGYTVADTLTVVGGDGTAATLTVATVDGGVITGVTVASGGDYVVFPANPVSVTGGDGEGATFNLTATGLVSEVAYELAGGVDDNELTTHVTGWTLFNNPATSDVWQLVDVSAVPADIDAITTVVEGRQDCVGFFGPPLAAVLNNQGFEADDVIEFRAETTNKSSSYLMMNDNWKKVYDEFNDVYRWIPMSASDAGLHAQVVGSPQPWFSHAGYTRGRVKNVVQLAWNSRKPDRDSMYKKNVNSFISEPGEGVILFGDKTQQQRPSAFDRINVRNLFIVMRKAITTAAKYNLFELNDVITRSLFSNRSSAFLETVQSGRGVYDYRVKCDEENNTAEVIDNNGFVGSIFVKPARSINFIQLNFVAVATGVEFSEIEGAV